MKKYFYTFLVFAGLAVLSWANIRDIKRTEKESFALGCQEVLVNIYMDKVDKPKFSELQEYCNNTYANKFPD